MCLCLNDSGICYYHYCQQIPSVLIQKYIIPFVFENIVRSDGKLRLF